MSTTILTEAQVAKIARRYDGTTETIDYLVHKFRCARHTVRNAASRLGKTRGDRRKAWTEEDDKFLREHWGVLGIEEIAHRMGRSHASLANRKKRLGLSMWDMGEDSFTIRDLEQLTRIDHRLWQNFIAQGWLTASRVTRMGDAPHSTADRPRTDRGPA
jgi:hypothetical protein